MSPLDVQHIICDMIYLFFFNFLSYALLLTLTYAFVVIQVLSPPPPCYWCSFPIASMCSVLRL